MACKLMTSIAASQWISKHMEDLFLGDVLLFS
ncbi:hypothetical protein ANCCAN_27210 [Ancylostoma caninum]|uniref:Uncharacterized protein n=1 Tax=Ancylostoma caninum TaxID=29170 RepID=A0A368F4N5_ANCCA|nr:hypothetical protein ANCCAN_27210 [Ancylostoma caninum]